MIPPAQTADPHTLEFNVEAGGISFVVVSAVAPPTDGLESYVEIFSQEGSHDVWMGYRLNEAN